jgi:hypothetical protein
MLLPVLGAVFFIGKDIIYKEININDSVIATFFKYLKKSLRLFKFIPLHFMLLLNIAGMIVSAGAGNLTYSIICLTFTSILLVIMLYLVGYFVFVIKTGGRENMKKSSGKEEMAREKNVVMEVIALMLLKPQFVIPVFAGIVLCVFFFSNTLLTILCFLGTFFLTALEAVIFIQILYYKKAIGILDEEEEYAYLVDGSLKNKGFAK